MKGRWLWVLALLFFIWGCAGSRTFWMDIRYLPGSSQEKIKESRVVAISPFRDMRKDGVRLGAWTRPRDRVDTFMASKPVDQAVTEAISGYFRSRGYRVVEHADWDLRPESLSRISADYVVGGEINRLNGDAWTSVRTRVQLHVQLQIYVGKVKEEKVVGQKMEISKEIVGVTSKAERIEAALNQELSEAIERAFQGIL